MARTSSKPADPPPLDLAAVRAAFGTVDGGPAYHPLTFAADYGAAHATHAPRGYTLDIAIGDGHTAPSGDRLPPGAVVVATGTMPRGSPAWTAYLSVWEAPESA